MLYIMSPLHVVQLRGGGGEQGQADDHPQNGLDRPPHWVLSLQSYGMNSTFQSSGSGSER